MCLGPDGWDAAVAPPADAATTVVPPAAAPVDIAPTGWE